MVVAPGLRYRNFAFSITTARHGSLFPDPSSPCDLSSSGFSSTTRNRNPSPLPAVPFFVIVEGLVKQWHAREQRYLNTMDPRRGRRQKSCAQGDAIVRKTRLGLVLRTRSLGTFVRETLCVRTYCLSIPWHCFLAILILQGGSHAELPWVSQRLLKMGTEFCSKYFKARQSFLRDIKHGVIALCRKTSIFFVECHTSLQIRKGFLKKRYRVSNFLYIFCTF